MGKLWIENEHLRLDNGKKVKAISPTVIAASRVTDIPAHYCDWFFERLRRGYMACPLVGSTRKMHRYVSFANTQFIVFFSKNPRPLISYLPQLKEKEIDFYINFTLNDYSHLGFESGLDIEAPLQMRIDTFKRLADTAGPERVVWHFDPLILSPKVNVDKLMERISSIAEQLKGYTNQLVFGFLNVPKESIVESNLKVRKLHFKPWTTGMKAVIVKEIAKANKMWGFELSTCSDADDYTKYGVKQGRCVDYQLITRLAWQNKFLMDSIGSKIYTYDAQPSLFGDVEPLPQGAIMLDSKHYILPEDRRFYSSNITNPGENQCRCNYSFDIGTKGTCTYKCAYCYAAEPSYRLDANVKAHGLNPTAASLTGEPDDELHIAIESNLQPKGIQLDRSLKSMNSGRIDLNEAAEIDKNDPYYVYAARISRTGVVTVNDIEYLKQMFPNPSLIPGVKNEPSPSSKKKSSRGKINQVTVKEREEEEVIIDPEDETDSFADIILHDSESASSAQEKNKTREPSSKQPSNKKMPTKVTKKEVTVGSKEKKEVHSKDKRKEQSPQSLSSSLTKSESTKASVKTSANKSEKTNIPSVDKGKGTPPTTKDAKKEVIIPQVDIDGNPIRSEADIDKEILTSKGDREDNSIPSETNNPQEKPQFNALDFLREIRESKRFDSEKEVLEEFVKKVNTLVVGVNDEIIGITEYTDGNGLKLRNPDKKDVEPQEEKEQNTNSDTIIDDSSSIDTVSSNVENSSDQENQPDTEPLYSFINKTYPDKEDIPKHSTGGSSCVTDLKDVKEELEKALENNKQDPFIDEEDVHELEAEFEALIAKVGHSSADARTSTQDPTDKWYDFNAEISRSLGSDRNSLRNMMKKK